MADKASESGTTAPTDKLRGVLPDENKMEDNLIKQKENKVSTNSPDEVAGRQGKGLGLVDKLVPGKSSK
ncbi:hypothetical protein H2203_006556 [Taxawa tesnikishii (nom. ined.)]|nr:hypothetical protein H2203_006556 [Dothideales sp. JES 119]